MPLPGALTSTDGAASSSTGGGMVAGASTAPGGGGAGRATAGGGVAGAGRGRDNGAGPAHAASARIAASDNVVAVRVQGKGPNFTRESSRWRQGQRCRRSNVHYMWSPR